MKKLTNILLTFSAVSMLLVGCGEESSKTSGSYKSKNHGDPEKNVNLRTFDIEYKDENNIIFSWEPVKNVDSYEVKIAKDFMSVNYTIPLHTNKAEINVAGLTKRTWWIKVKAKGSEADAVGKFTIIDYDAYIDAKK